VDQRSELIQEISIKSAHVCAYIYFIGTK